MTPQRLRYEISNSEAQTAFGFAVLHYHFCCLSQFGILLASLLIHEAAHAAVACCLGGHISHIILWPLGGLAYLGQGGGLKEEILIALAGPLVHVPFGILFGMLLKLGDHQFSQAFIREKDISDSLTTTIIAGAFRIQVTHENILPVGI